MRSSRHTSTAALGMTFFQKMRQLVAVLGMHHHLKALAGFGLFGRHPASFVCARSGRCIGGDLVFDRFGRLTHSTSSPAVEARVAYSFKPSLMASAISSMLTVLLIRLPPLQTAMNLQDLLLDSSSGQRIRYCRAAPGSGCGNRWKSDLSSHCTSEP